MAILDHIYECVTEDQALEALPAMVASTLGARSCSMLAYDGTRQITRFVANHFTPEMYAFQQTPEIAALDVWTAVGARPDRIGRVTNCADHWDTPTFRQTPYFNECIRRFGDDSVHCMGGVIRSADGYLAFAVHSGHQARPFGPRQASRLAKLTPHVFRMMDLRARLGRARADADLLQSALDGIPGGVLALDAGLRIRAANCRAAAMLAAADGLRIACGRLVAVDLTIQERFAKAVRAAATWSGARADAILVARSDRRPPFRLIVSPLAGQVGLALLIIEDPEDRDATLAATFRGLFDLTASEAELAVLLAEGLTPEEAADARNVRLHTVRTQIKSLLDKTDARRLTDLVRILSRVPRRGPHAG